MHSGGPAASKPRRWKQVADWTERYRHIWEERLDRSIYLSKLMNKGEDMVVSSAVNSVAFRSPRPRSTEIRMTRLFDAPPELVFEAMTRPSTSGVVGATSARGYSVPVCEWISVSAASGAS